MQLLRDLLCLLQPGPQAREGAFAELGQGDAAAGAPEQPAAAPVLEVGDLPADVRLRRLAPRRHLAEAAGLGDLQEQLHARHIHRRASCSHA
jgi:hypothetical protein